VSDGRRVAGSEGDGVLLELVGVAFGHGGSFRCALPGCPKES
jgi:hypothetical protein